MKTIIAGGRHFVPTAVDIERLNKLKVELPITHVISGGATGADMFGWSWAKNNKLGVTLILPKWATFGKGAGFLRNTEMVEKADALVAFPGGNGTADTIRKAKLKGLKVVIFT